MDLHKRIIRLRQNVAAAEAEVQAEADMLYAEDVNAGDAKWRAREEEENILAETDVAIATPDNFYPVIACGDRFVAAINRKGEVFTWGRGFRGQLGHNKERGERVPRKVEGIIDAIDIACGEEHTIVLLSNGTIVTMGDNVYGQLGFLERSHELLPRLLVGLENIIQVACGDHCTVALDHDGRMWFFGNRIYEDLIGPRIAADRSDIVYIAAAYTNIAFITSEGYAHVRGHAWLPKGRFIRIADMDNAVMIACGGFHVAILCADRSVKMAGHNPYTGLGVGVAEEHNRAYTLNGLPDAALTIACGMYHTVIVDLNGDVFTFGSSKDGQLGNGIRQFRNAVPTRIPQLHNIIEVTAGEAFTAAIDRNGYIYTWGKGKNGELGYGAVIDRQPVPRRIETLIL